LTVAGLEKLGDVTALVLLATPLLWIAPQLAVGWWLIALSALAVAAGIGVTLLRQHPSFRNRSPLAGLQLFDRPGPVAVALACVLMAWIFDVVTIELVLGAVGARPTLSAALTVLLMTNLAIAVPVTPGNVGAHELGSAFALRLLGVQAETATALALLYHGLDTVLVLLAGFVDDTRDALAAADVFLLASAWEGLPRAVLEATAAGLPCVVAARARTRKACGR